MREEEAVRFTCWSSIRLPRWEMGCWDSAELYIDRKWIGGRVAARVELYRHCLIYGYDFTTRIVFAASSNKGCLGLTHLTVASSSDCSNVRVITDYGSSNFVIRHARLVVFVTDPTLSNHDANDV